MLKRRYALTAICCLILAISPVNALGIDDSKVINGDNELYINQTTNSTYVFAFGLNPIKHEIITRYGTLPELGTEKQKQEWVSVRGELNENLKEDMITTYMYPSGQVLTCGYNSNGYLVILFENKTIEKESMDEIYSIVNEKAMNMGIQEVPVEFGRGDYWYRLETAENLSESEIEATKEYMKSGKDIWYWSLYKEETVIARYGELPLLIEEDQRTEFDEDLQEILNEAHSEMEPYLFGGQVVTYGIRYGPSIDVGINKNATKETQILCNEIYGILDKKARQRSISNVPVTFVKMEQIVPDVEIKEEDENDSGSTGPQPGDVSARQTPGFGLLGGLSCVLYGWLFKKSEWLHCSESQTYP